MAEKYREYDKLNLPEVAEETLAKWDADDVFQKSIESREGKDPFIFYEGPPSANGMPGIHHVMARTIKDLFCRYKTLKGYQVKRKAGWDTHGLPVELGVEKELGITKEDIGKKISIEEYNEACKKAVMRYTDVWNDLTKKMGYWVDMDDPYITYKSKYMESVWWLLKNVYDKGLLYKGYTIQPYSPAAGTGLSSHELNQPGTYRDVKDATVTAQFKVIRDDVSEFLFDGAHGDVFLLAWTTTPWTLPSNTALAVGPKIDYVKVATYNQYTHEPITVLLAKDLVNSVFSKKFKPEDDDYKLEDYKEGDKKIPYRILKEFKGADLTGGIRYEQLLPYAQPHEGADGAYRVIEGDYVTTEDGTGIVHIAPTFGADDARVAKDAGVPPMLVKDENDNLVPLVDLKGRFREEMKDDVFGLGGEYVKPEYYSKEEREEEQKKQAVMLKSIIPNLTEYLSVDERIGLKLKLENKAFKIEKYVHSYPHCWRTDKPVLYYPLDSWFIKVTDKKDRLIDLNKTINWKPASTGTGRFGNWLENLNDWNLSRSRFWGIPIPVWRTEDGKEEKCIGSIEELYNECEKAVSAGVMDKNPVADFTPGDMSEENYEKVDLHKHLMDKVTLVSESGKPMVREADLIDVWFDSGSMPYAQWHYPFENKEMVENGEAFPADFIAEGVDQTRGWFYTLHAIATLNFDSVAYENVVSNGLVLDKNGQKMSKRLGNAVDPFETLKKYGPDATRWYMITNAQPWDNLRFDLDGITEVQRKFFGTLYNTYSFFALYANIDGFDYSEDDIVIEKRPELDRWILSRLNSVAAEVDEAFAAYEPTRAGRVLQNFVVDEVSNWYVRLSRRRFWKGDYAEDKISAYQTLYTVLDSVARMASPIAPFYMDRLYGDLNRVSKKETAESVHLALFPGVKADQIDRDLERKMYIAQKVSSMVLSIRKREKIKVRQPLQKIMVPVLDKDFGRQIKDVEDLILSEVNVKDLELLEDTKGVLVKNIKPNFKTIGPKYGKLMKSIAAMVNDWGEDMIAQIEKNDGWTGEIEGEEVELTAEDFEITTEDIPGWAVQSEEGITVALDVTLSDELKDEGIARDFVNRIQNFRKDLGFEVTDKITLSIKTDDRIERAINNNKNYICSETLAGSLELVESVDGESLPVEIGDGIETEISISKLN